MKTILLLTVVLAVSFLVVSADEHKKKQERNHQDKAEHHKDRSHKEHHKERDHKEHHKERSHGHHVKERSHNKKESRDHHNKERSHDGHVKSAGHQERAVNHGNENHDRNAAVESTRGRPFLGLFCKFGEQRLCNFNCTQLTCDNYKQEVGKWTQCLFEQDNFFNGEQNCIWEWGKLDCICNFGLVRDERTGRCVKQSKCNEEPTTEDPQSTGEEEEEEEEEEEVTTVTDEEGLGVTTPTRRPTRPTGPTGVSEPTPRTIPPSWLRKD